MPKTLQVNYTMPSSKANGPGNRFTIWVQGCSIHCPGCTNVATWDPTGGLGLYVSDLLRQIKETPPPIHGVTITGGEPLDQFEAVYSLCKELFGTYSVFLTTGYTLKQIKEKHMLRIMDVLDIVCVGPFEKDKVCKGQWKGSENQEVIPLTSLGSDLLAMPVVSTEIRIGQAGDSVITGFTK